MASSHSTRARQQNKQKKSKTTQFWLRVEDEQVMCDFLHDNTMIWDIKTNDYRRVDKKAKLWEDQAQSMGQTVEHLQGWFKSMRDIHTRLLKKKSGDGAPELTEREHWLLRNFVFLKAVVRHRPQPVSSVRATIAGHNGDLEAAEAACAETMDDDDIVPPTVPSTSQRKSKRATEEDDMLQTLQKRVHESGDLLKALNQPRAITSTTAFANYVRDSLVTMSKANFRKARVGINTILSNLMEDDSDAEDVHTVSTLLAPVPVPVRPSSAPVTYMPTASELYQPPPLQMWRHKAPEASVHGSTTAEYVGQYLQQPMQSQYHHQQQQQPTYQQLMAPPHTPPLPRVVQPPATAQQRTSDSSVSAALASAEQILNQSPSDLDTSMPSFGSISGLSGLLNLSGQNGASIPSTSNTPDDLRTPPLLEKR